MWSGTSILVAMLKTPIPHGFLIAVEGIDGAGKTSLATLLAQWCGERGLACVISKEPTSLKWGQELRASAKAGRLTLERELELFELDRRQHVTNTIKPAMEAGGIVILDRYYWSSAAYQGARGADPQEIMASNERFAPQPDLVIILDSEVDVGLHRIRARGDKPNEFENKSLLQKSRDIFRQISANHPASYTIDSSGYLKESFDLALSEFLRRAEAKIQASGLPDAAERIAQLRID
jgi:dTMP kinase